MNTDIRIAIDFWQHPKTKKLIRRVGIEGVRSLQILWAWAANNKPDGNLEGLDEEDIELAADWQGDIGVFFKALIETRWIDEADNGYVLHEWLEHNPWVADDENRGNKARLSKLQQVNVAAYDKCVLEGKTGITRAEYESLKNYTATAEAESEEENSDRTANAERPQSDRQHDATANASDSLAPKPIPRPVKLKAPLSPKGDIPPRTPAPSPKTPRAKFVPPTVEEVQAYCDARCNGISAQRFCDYYASQGWKKNNGQPVKDWQACVRQWEDRDRNEAQLPAVSQGAPHFSNYGQEVKYQQQQQAQALLAARDIFKQNPEDIPPEWR